MTENMTKFSKAGAALNTKMRAAGFKKAVAAVNVADELHSRGIFFGPEQNEK